MALEGIIITRACKLFVHEDERRKLTEVFNAMPGDILADFAGRQLKILEVKEDEAVLGNHYHPYRELFFLARGEAAILLEGADRRTGRGTGETDVHDLREGDRILFPSYVAHRVTMNRGSILIGLTEQPYLGSGKSDRKYDFETHRTIEG